MITIKFFLNFREINFFISFLVNSTFRFEDNSDKNSKYINFMFVVMPVIV